METHTQLSPQWREQFVAQRNIDDKLCALQQFLFTSGLLVNVRIEGLTYDYDARYCYERFADCLEALTAWDGKGDPPGPWIKEKVSERLGPGALA